MDSRKEVLKQTGIIAAGVLLCSGLMVGVFALLGHFSLKVVISALAGSMTIILKHLLLSYTTTNHFLIGL